MGMAVNETRHGHHAGTLNNGLRQLLRHFFGNKLNFSVGNADVYPKKHFRSRGHGHGGDVGN